MKRRDGFAEWKEIGEESWAKEARRTEMLTA